MAFLSGFVKSGLSLLGKDNSGFGYNIGDKVEFYSEQSLWNLHRGTKKASLLYLFLFMLSLHFFRRMVLKYLFSFLIV